MDCIMINTIYYLCK